MPKVTNTRRQKAFKLLRILNDGPSLGLPGAVLTATEYQEQLRSWASFWVLSALKDLVPANLSRLRQGKKHQLEHSLTQGPELFPKHSLMTLEQAEDEARLWIGNWIKPMIVDLVPELRKQQEG